MREKLKASEAKYRQIIEENEMDSPTNSSVKNENPLTENETRPWRKTF